MKDWVDTIKYLTLLVALIAVVACLSASASQFIYIDF